MKYIITCILLLSACVTVPRGFDACDEVKKYYQPRAQRMLVVYICVKEFRK